MNKLNKNFSAVVNCGSGSYRDCIVQGTNQMALLQLGYYIVEMREQKGWDLRDIANSLDTGEIIFLIE